MLEDHPKVSELAAADWVLTLTPASITVPVEIPSSPQDGVPAAFRKSRLCRLFVHYSVRTQDRGDLDESGRRESNLRISSELSFPLGGSTDARVHLHFPTIGCALKWKGYS